MSRVYILTNTVYCSFPVLARENRRFLAFAHPIPQAQKIIAFFLQNPLHFPRDLAIIPLERSSVAQWQSIRLLLHH